MIDKLQPREMIRVSFVAKKLHEVIDKINQIEDKVQEMINEFNKIEEEVEQWRKEKGWEINEKGEESLEKKEMC